MSWENLRRFISPKRPEEVQECPDQKYNNQSNVQADGGHLVLLEFRHFGHVFFQFLVLVFIVLSSST